MKLSSVLSKESILQIETNSDKWCVIRAMIDQLNRLPFVAELNPSIKSSFFREVEQREKFGCTGLGQDLAFPHARIEGLERPLVAFATIRNGVDFGAPDDRPARLVLLILLPAGRPELGVKLISVCSRFFQQTEVRNALLEAAGAEEIHRIIDQNSLEIDAPIIALDLMRGEPLRLTPDLPGREATQLMHRWRAVAAPVVDQEQHVIGELNCNTLFLRELPDYITRLHSVPHISDFRPFQKYFSHDSHLTVGDLMDECTSVIDENGSLLEIIFLLSVKKHPLLYVCRNGLLIGVIDAITVVDKVLNC
jgi:mannitol/fructose-specific phosphotransferase system IIA component (Ntr-type)